MVEVMAKRVVLTVVVYTLELLVSGLPTLEYRSKKMIEVGAALVIIKALKQVSTSFARPTLERTKGFVEQPDYPLYNLCSQHTCDPATPLNTSNLDYTVSPCDTSRAHP